MLCIEYFQILCISYGYIVCCILNTAMVYHVWTTAKWSPSVSAAMMRAAARM